MAFVSVDNAVEVTLRTYLGLPQRARGTPGPSRRRLADASNSFPDLLDLLEDFTTDHLEGIELGDVEWYHRLRNALYHEGNGITVDRSHVDAYLQIARVLVSRLLGAETSEIAYSAPSTAVGDFILQWALLEHNLKVLIGHISNETSYRFRYTLVFLREVEVITGLEEEELLGLLALRWRVVHQPASADVDEVVPAVARIKHYGAHFAAEYADQSTDSRS